MQLIGKVALSATAVFILALAYRFYKLRKLESTGPNEKQDPGCVTEKITSVETPLRDHIGEEASNLRFRCVHNNLQNSSLTDHGNKNLAELPVTVRQAQEGLLTADVTCKDQRGLKIVQLHKEDDPLQSQQQFRDDTDVCDGEETITTTESGDYRRQEPEGGEMQGKLELAKGSLGQDSEDHDNERKEKLHQDTSTHRQDDDNTDGGPTQTRDQREKTVASNSQSVTDKVDHQFEIHGHQSPLTDLLPSTENWEKSQQEATNNNNNNTEDKAKAEATQLPNSFNDIQKTEDQEDNSTQPQDIQCNVSPPATASSLSSNQSEEDSSGLAHSGPKTYHISIDAESKLDINLELGNCYDVLCLAKKYNHDVLLAEAYKIMSDNYLEILQNPNIYGRLNATERDLILENRMKGRRFVVVADIDTQAINSSANQSSLSYYDSDYDRWQAMSNIPSEAVSRGCSMAALFNYIFIVLGSDGLDRQMKPTKRVLCYNPLTDTWKEVAPLKEARPHCKLVALDGCLYAIGGECLHTVERYDPRQNRWSYIAPLPNDTFAVAHMATAYDDEIYVTGGTIRYMLLRYNLREKIWKNSHISGSKDRTTEIVVANNFLYRFDLNRNMGISVHRCNIRARIWNFHLRFLADEVSPRFMEVDLQTVPLPKGILYPIVLVLGVK
ncbi:hypothetical protein GDO81_014597 [Engystomops pustulosus]|uniref:Uncharacterized protein n=1 Tax=Engystomops pustulosus TaxID=76066 RepID=A0AAV7BBL2_ENGPU|nr:hypothetical protein GDO81_014597 [Engystomops pustulosus]